MYDKRREEKMKEIISRIEMLANLSQDMGASPKNNEILDALEELRELQSQPNRIRDILSSPGQKLEEGSL